MTTDKTIANTAIKVNPDYFEYMKTGDIILFSGKHSIISYVVEWFTSSFWSHIGIVLKNPVYIDPKLKGYYLLESGYEDFPDSENNTRKFGVQITNLKYKVNEYDGTVVWRKLDASVDNMEDKIKQIYTTSKDKSYDLNLLDFLETSMNINNPEPEYSYAILNYFRPNHRKTDKFFCSALVAYIYTELGLFPENIQWTKCIPKYFSEENLNLTLTHGKLGKQVIIKSS